MARGRQPNTNREINWVTDEDGNVLGYMKDAKTLIPITELSELSEAQLANPLIKGAAGVGNGRIYDENAQEIGPTAQLAVVNIGQGSTTVLDSSVNNKRFVCAGMPEVTINAGVSGFNVAHFSGDFWFTGTATVTDKRTFGVSPEATLRKISGDNYVLTGTKGYVQQDIGVRYTGVNISGLEFGTAITPTKRSVDFWYSRGANYVRLPFKWELVQPVQQDVLDATYVAHIQSVIDACAARGMLVELDLHNYGAYNSNSALCTTTTMADVWGRLATQFGSNSNVCFNLMNEPGASDYTGWAAIVNASVAAIRAAGFTGRILIPAYSGASADTVVNDNFATYVNMLVDPLINWVLDCHKYFDNAQSGIDPRVRGPNAMRNFLQPVTAVARKLGIKLSLGEFGGGTSNTNAITCVSRGLAYLNANADVWESWAMWGAGSSWSQSYALKIQSSDTYQDTPQSLAQRPYFSGGSRRDGVRKSVKGVYTMLDTAVTFGQVNGETALTAGSADAHWSVGIIESGWSSDWVGPTYRMSPFTVDLKVMVPSGYAGGSDKWWINTGTAKIGISASGQIKFNYGSVFVNMTGNIADGVPRNIRFCYSGQTGGRLFVDGQLSISSTTTGVAAGASSNGHITIGAGNPDNSDSAPSAGAPLMWAAIWQGDLSYSNFEPRIYPPTGDEPNLTAVWLLDGDTSPIGLGI